MTVYLRWIPGMRDAFGNPKTTPRIGAIGVVVQTDSYGQFLVDFDPANPPNITKRFWCRPDDVQLVSERDYWTEKAMEALGAEANKEA